MTTLLIDDELGRQARQAAAAQGKSLDEFVRDALQRAVGGASVNLTDRHGVPVITVSPPIKIDPSDVRRALEEDGF